MTQFASTLYPQTNPTNPILLEVRNLSRSYTASDFPIVVANYLDFVSGAYAFEWSEKHKDHAIRVLTRLANFSG